MSSRLQRRGQLTDPQGRPRDASHIFVTPAPLVQTFTAQDATPSVIGHEIFKTANTSSTTISDFDDGETNQRIVVIIDDDNTTVDFTSSGLKGNKAADWTPSTGDHMICTYDGTDWYCHVSGRENDYVLTAKKTADQTKNNTTLADITGLSFPVVSGEYYRFVFNLVMRTATATTGPRVSLTFPSVTTMTARATIPVTTAGTGRMFTGSIRSSGQAVIGTALPQANADYLVTIEGNILPSATGTLQAQFANETGTVVVTCRQGSTGLLQRVP